MLKLTIPQLDAAGHMIRRLKAESATGPLKTPKLSMGVVEFFRPQETNPEKLATLRFNEAVYHSTEEIINGDCLINLDSPRGDLNGVGFNYQLITGKLVLKSSVVIDLPNAHVTGETAEAFFNQNTAIQDSFIQQATISGKVTVTGIKSDKYPFDRAETAKAVYTASDGLLRLSSPVICWRNGQQIQASANEISVDVRSQLH